MTPAVVVAAVALRAAVANCPQLADRPPTITTRPPIPSCAGHAGCWTNAAPTVVYIDFARARRWRGIRWTVAHEAGHACAVANGHPAELEHTAAREAAADRYADEVVR